MKKSLGKRDIQEVMKSKRVFRTRFFSIKVTMNQLNYSRIGFAFSRRVGSAVLRNRFKRRLREIIRLSTDSKGCDFVCIATGNLEQIHNSLWIQEKKRILGFCDSL